MIEYRAIERKDAHYLIDIDLKCFDYPWLPSDWRDISNTCFGTVATYRGTPIGMIVFKVGCYGDIEVLKIAVKPTFRNRGIGKRLLFHAICYGQTVQASHLVLVIPETQINPGHTNDLSKWLSQLHFRAQAPLLRNHYRQYGEDVDGVVFTLRIPSE
jgi:GNAT superfamily N-acetyltransferase